MKILELFGRFTGLRHASLSEKSGEEFYHLHLNSAFKEAIDEDKIFDIDLNGIRGYSPSFIDEVFGNLIYDFGEQNINRYLNIISDNKFWLDSIKNETFKNWKIRINKKEDPIKTMIHDPWWRLNDKNIFEKKIWYKPSN